MKLVKKIYRGARLRVRFFIWTFIGKLQLLLRGISPKNMMVNGHILMNGAEKSNLIFGKSVKINSGIKANMIGYPCPTIFQIRNGRVLIGNNVGISNTVFVSINAKIEVKDDVLIGSGCKIYTTDFHSISYEDRILNKDLKNIVCKDVCIEKGCFIGAGTTILKGVTIGEKSVVGACSVVTKSIPSGEIWAGNPAKFIKTIG